MTTLTFDTLAYAKKLKSVGFTEAQADAQAETIISLITEQLTTKTDLKELDDSLTYKLKELEDKLTFKLKELEAKMKELETGLKRDMKELEDKLTYKMKELEAKMKEMEFSLEAKIEHTKSETIKWVAAMLVAQAAVIAAMVKLI
ncbi:MAG: hypothetical protein HQK91_15130 [Nitrospirae bacterium]|nr:hypothetical protein [Nitrospirota bacterium]